MRRNGTVLSQCGLAILMVLGLLLGLVNPGWAATYTVTTNADSGAGSLRQAISDANTLTPGADTINFAVSTITLTGGEIVISDDLTIQGPGATHLTISGNNNSRIFNVASGKTVVINDLSLQNGYTTAFAGGGAILNSGILTVQHSALISNVSDCTAACVGHDVGGGAIANASGGILTITDSAIANNSSNLSSGWGAGGGIWSNGTLTILRSTLSSNSASSNGGGGLFAAGSTNVTIDSSTLSGNTGGGLNFEGGVATITNSTVTGNANGGINSLTNGTLKLINSTVASNTIDRGIWNYQGTLIITNSTVSGNPEGGIYVGSGTASITNSTITGNGNASSDGGGIYSFGPVTIGNSLVAGNMGSFANRKEMFINGGPITSQGYNLFGENGDPGIYCVSCTYTPATNDLTLPSLVSAAINTTLADNGGPTKTHLPVALGPAINAGLDGLVPTGVTTDQRGATRFNGTVDIGAVEGSVVTSSIVTPYAALNGSISPNTPQTVNHNTTTSFTVTPNTGYTALVTGCGGSLTGSLYITGPITSNCTVSASFTSTSFIVTNLNDSGPGSLRQVVADANAVAGADTVTFQTGLTGIITLTTGEIVISDDLTIQGPGAATLAIARNITAPLARIFNITAVNVTINDLTLKNGYAPAGERGGAILNAGALTINRSVFDSNQASLSGGAIRSSGTLNITNTTFSNNTAKDGGGGAIVNTGPATIQNCIASGNKAEYAGTATAADGGAFYNAAPGTMNVSTSTISGNTAVWGGGGIANTGAIVTVRDSTISGNTANGGNGHGGGGLFNFGSTMNVINSTVSGNSAPSAIIGGTGGGVENTGTLTITNSTITGNAANLTPGTGYGGGIYNGSGGATAIGNSLITGNNAPVSSGREIYIPSGAVSSQNYNLVGYSADNGITTSGTGTTTFPQANDITPTVALNAIIGSLADNGGPTKTHLPLPGAINETAIEAGSNALAGAITTDQRGGVRIVNTNVDIGSVEADAYYQLTVTVVGGAGSGTVSDGGSINCPGTCTAFFPPATPVNLTANQSPGFTFTGWSGACTGTGTCAVTMSGNLTVNASFAPVTTFVVTNLNDSGAGSLRQVVADANGVPGANTVTFDPSLSGPTSKITLTTGEIIITDNLTIQGPGASQLAVSGNNASRIFTIASGKTVVIDSLKLQNGYTPNAGGAIDNAGTLTVSHCDLINSTADGFYSGGAISSGGTLTVINSSLSGNTGGHGGGAIDNTGTADVINSVLSNNTSLGNNGGIFNWTTMTVTGSTLSGNNGYGIANYGTLTVMDSTLVGNVGGGLSNGANTLTVINSTLTNNTCSGGCGGAGIANYTGTVIVTNSTVSGNTADHVGGGIHSGFGAVKVTNSTITGNSANSGGGIFCGVPPVSCSVTIGNSLVAGNTTLIDGKEVGIGPGGIFTSQGHNLFGVNNDAGITGALPNTGLGDIVPGTGVFIGNIIGGLANHGGPTQTHLPLPGGLGNTAIDAGDDVLATTAGLTTDQRGSGFPRKVGSRVDIGAVEEANGYFLLTVTRTGSGSGTVSSSPPGISCGTACTQSYVNGTVVTLTAGANAGSAFTGWGGACSGTGSCVVTMSIAQNVTATFNLATYTVTPSAGTNGSISPVTPQPATLNQQLTFTVSPSIGYTAGVGGTCGGTLVGTLFTTNPVTADCTVVASFSSSPTLSINSVSQNEGNTGTTPLVFTVTLSAAAALPVTVNWATANDTATAGSDYTAASGSLTFAPGVLTQPVTVQITGDTLAEPNETFFVNLSTPVNATIAQAQGTGTILNDDGAARLTGIAWSSSQFVTVGEGGTLLTSLDGINWLPVTPSPTVENLYGVAWSGSRFVAVGGAGTVLTSPNGTTWNGISPPPTTQDLNGIVWSGGQFVVVGSGGAILTSPNGATWTPQSAGTTADLLGVAWSGSQFVAVGSGGTILTSTTGTTWTPQSSGTTQPLYGIAWSGSEFVTVGGGGAILASPNGLTWNPRSAGTTQDLRGVAWSGSQFLTVGSGGTALASLDGIAWITQASGTTQNLNGLSWAGNRFIAVGDNDTISPITVQSTSAKILNSNVWTAIALPMTPVAPGTVQSVLGNSLGGIYDTDWVVWSYDPVSHQSRKLAATDPLTPGLGYWIRKYSPGSVSLTATGTATPVTAGNPHCPTAAGCYEIALMAPPGSDSRYTLLGMPFPYPVGWWDVRLQVDGVAYTLNDPANIYVAPAYWLWNGNGYDSYDGTTPGMVGILQPWQGFWMQVHPASQGHSLKLLIPPIPKYGFTPPPLIPAIAQSLASTSPGFRALDWLMAPAAASEPDDPAWYVRLIAETSTPAMRDRNNVFGQIATAAAGHDPHDLPKLAPFSPPSLSVVFPHPDWGPHAGDYASDYRPNRAASTPGRPADRWRFAIRTDRAGYPLRLRWEGPPDILSRSEVIDEDTGSRYPANDPALLHNGIPLTMTAPVRYFTWIFAGQPEP